MHRGGDPRVHEQGDEILAISPGGHGNDAVAALGDTSRRGAARRQVDHHRHQSFGRHQMREQAHMFDPVLDDRHPRLRTAQAIKPGLGGLRAVGLGGDQHPVHGLGLCRRGPHLGPCRKRAMRRLDHQIRKG